MPLPLRQRFFALALLAAVAMPLSLALLAALRAGVDLGAWRALVQEQRFVHSTLLTLGTGLGSSLLAVLLSGALLSVTFPGPAWARLVQLLGPLLAVPHAAFAIGFVALIAPSGWLLRLLSPWATGFEAPPPWATTQDPWGLGLVAVLVFKEVPFLLCTAAAQLQRADVAQRLAAELGAARCLGYSAQQAWWRVVAPQLGWQLRWPMAAVLAYGLTVVDVALVIGPTSPPTLGVQAWRWLQDADPARNAQGAAAAWWLALLLVLCVALVRICLGANAVRRWLTHGTDSLAQLSPKNLRHLPGTSRTAATRAVAVLLMVYAAVMLALWLGSFSGVWAFPALWPQRITLDAWARVAASATTVGTTFTLGLASALTALVWAVAWLECAPARWDAALRNALYLPVVLPGVLWVVGLHSVALQSGLDASWVGLWLAHLLAVLPYVLIALDPAYAGFDARYWQLSASMGKSKWVFLWRVKLPLLRAPLSMALAIGFAVSVAQYLPTLFIGAGRFNTVTTEAISLAAGAQRSLTSAYAALQWLLPALVFGLAAWLGRPRRF